MKDKRIIRLIAGKKLYTTKPLLLLAPEQSGKYYTGQEEGGNYKDLGLTAKQMLGEEALTNQQKAKIKYVINPVNTLRFVNGHKFDLDTDRGLAEYEFITQKHFPEIAKSKLEYNENKVKYTHYLEDKELDAKKEVAKEDEWYNARKLIDNLSIDRLVQVGLLLRHTVKSFNINPTGASKEILLKNIYKLCKEDPNAVMQCFPEHNKAIEKILLVAEFLHHNILQWKGTNIYDGASYIANNTDGVIEYISKDDSKADYDRWCKTLLEKKQTK